MVVKIKSQNYCAVILSVPIALVKITHQTCIWFTFFAKGCVPEHRLFIWVNRAAEFWVHVATFIVLAETPFWWKQNATTTELLLVVSPHCMKLDGLDLCCNYFLEVKGYLKKKKKGNAAQHVVSRDFFIVAELGFLQLTVYDHFVMTFGFLY